MKSANRVLGPQDRVSPQQTASPISISERANVATQIRIEIQTFF